MQALSFARGHVAGTQSQHVSKSQNLMVEAAGGFPIYVFQELRDRHWDLFSGLTTRSIRETLLEGGKDADRIVVGAYAWPSPAGLAVAEMQQDGSATLRSISVLAAYRRCGIGAGLLRHLKQAAHERGVRALSIEHLGSEPLKPEVLRLLARSGWPAFTKAGVQCITTHTLLREAPWMKHAHFPRGFETLPWREISGRELDAMRQEQQQDPWFPERLNPFRQIDSIDLPTSQALRYEGRIVGWCVNRRTAPRDLYCSSLFVRRELQPRGHAIRLLAYTLRNLDGMQIEKTCFDVSAMMQGMMAFFEKHMLPYTTAVRTFHCCSLELMQVQEPFEVSR